MVKVESILKWKLEGPVLKKIKMMRAQILNKNEDAVAIPDSDLHLKCIMDDNFVSEHNLFDVYEVQYIHYLQYILYMVPTNLF